MRQKESEFGPILDGITLPDMGSGDAPAVDDPGGVEGCDCKGDKS